jgi:nicotinamidase-related amidase
MNSLVIIDLQEDFISGTFANPKAQKVVNNIVTKTKRAIHEHWNIYVTMDSHVQLTYKHMAESKQYDMHCEKGTSGANLCSELGKLLAGYEHLHVIEKSTFGSFDLLNALHNYSEDSGTIEICGLCTDICVISNALMIRSACPMSEIIVDADACAGTSEEAHNAALEVMGNNSIVVRNTNM